MTLQVQFPQEQDVQLLSSLGNDLTVVNAARVSMAKESHELCEADKKLIAYLAKHNHWTPFAHVMLSFRVHMPIFVARQWYRHTVGIVRNEESRRYIDDSPAFFLPKYWRKQSASVKQGSSDEPVGDADEQLILNISAEDVYDDCESAYNHFLSKGVCREQARILLPTAMFTNFIETASLYAFARMCRLRLDGHAQSETTHYAELISAFCERIAPYSWKALMKTVKSE